MGLVPAPIARAASIIIGLAAIVRNWEMNEYACDTTDGIDRRRRSCSHR